MKIVIVNGQNHKGTSYHMGKALAQKLASENDTVEFFMPKDLNHFCLGCYACIEDETKCPFWSEKEKIVSAMQQADLFIFTTPNYCMAPSGAMKSFLDFMFDYWMVHKPKEWMFGKKAVVLSASAGATCKSVNQVVKKSLAGWGVSCIKTFGLPVNAKDWKGVPQTKKQKIEKKLSAIAKKLNENKKVKTSLSVKLTFAFMRMLHAKGWDSSPTEKQYWTEKGWMGKDRPWKKQKNKSDKTNAK